MFSQNIDVFVSIYIYTYLDKFSCFPKHYNFHEIMLYSQYPSKNFQVEICVLSNNSNSAQKLSIIDMTRSVSCFVCIEIIVFTLFA